MGPWILWGLVALKSKQRRAVLVSGFLAVGVASIQGLLVENWHTGAWGPLSWGRISRIHPGLGGSFFGGTHWTGIREVFQIFKVLLIEHDGIQGSLKNFAEFLGSRPLCRF